MADKRGRSNSEFNWSSYHDKQLNLFDTLNRSFTNSNKVNEALARGLSDTMMIMKNIAQSLTSNSRTSNQSQPASGDFMTASGFYIQAGRAADNLRRAAQEAEDLAKAHQKAAEAALEQSRAEKEAEEKKRREAEETKKNMTEAADTIMTAFKNIGEQANKFSATSNQLLQNSGMSRSAVQSFRSEFVSEVNELNRRTGYAYNSQAAYQSIVETVKGVTSSLEAIDEMATPLLLAQEGMNVDTHEVAQLLNKLYVRYSFSSESMEDLLDNIRSNTAGNSANEAATLANIEKLQNIMALDITDNETRTEYMKAISDITSHAESMGMDSGTLADMMKQIWMGSYQDNPLLMNILSRGGMSGDATNYLRSGDANSVRDVYEALINGVTTIVNEQKDAYSMETTIGNTTGMAIDQAADIFAAVTSENYQNLEEFLKDIKPKSVADTVEAKYISFQDKVLNQLSGIYAHLASIQEWAGIGFTDVAGIYFLGKKLLDFFGKGGESGVSTILGKTKGGLAKAGGKLGGNLAKAGGSTALGAAGALAGGALAVDGGIDVYKDIKDKDYTGAAISGVQVAGGATAAIALMAGSGPIGWTALAVAGIAALGKAAYDNATALTGNAAKVEKDIKSLNKTLKDENKQRIADLSELRYQFSQETDLDKQKKLLIEAGLATEQELTGKSQTYLQSLVDSYMNAAKQMDSVTDGLLKTAEKHYKNEQNKQQKEFVENLKGVTDSKDRENIIDLLIADTTDEDLKKKLKKKKKGGVTDAEWNDILYGGKNSWFDQNNILDKAVDVLTMKTIDGYLGWGNTYTTTDNMEAISRLMYDFSLAAATGIKSKMDEAYEAIEKSGMKEELRDIEEYDNKLKLYGYSLGTNYIPYDQLALLHEGEAVVPKKYNPAADGRITAKEVSELLDSRESEQQSRQSAEFISTLIDEIIEIKEFLRQWQTDNINREKAAESRNRNAPSMRMLTQYFS